MLVECRKRADGCPFLSRRDIEALKEYVSAPGNFGQNQAESTVRLHVTHSNLKAEFIELRLDLHVSLSFPALTRLLIAKVVEDPSC